MGHAKFSYSALLQVSCDSNLKAYTMFIYLKRKMQYLNKYYLFFTFADKNLFKCLHLLINSDFSFRRSSLLRNLIIHSFSAMHKGQIIELGFPFTFDAIEYLMEKLMLLRFNCQIYLANSMQFSYFSCLKHFVWFLYSFLYEFLADVRYFCVNCVLMIYLISCNIFLIYVIYIYKDIYNEVRGDIQGHLQKIKKTVL